MSPVTIVLLVILAVLIIGLIVLYFLGKKAQKKKAEQDEQLAAAVEMVDIAQPVEGLIDQIHRVIGTDHDAGTQEKSLNIVAPVKFHRQTADLLWRKGGTDRVIAPTIDTVMTVIDALVRK